MTQAVESALRNYPSIRVSQEQINAAAAGIQLARTAYLPRVDALAQVNRATRNNVFGLLLPQSVIPSISGPVLGTNNFGTAWGSALGALVSWEPFDFGLRRANARSPKRREPSPRRRCEAHRIRSRGRNRRRVSDAAGRARRRFAPRKPEWIARRRSCRTINALVNAQLRPGADASRAEAELAAARTQLIQAQQAAEIARATLVQFVGTEPAPDRHHRAGTRCSCLRSQPPSTLDTAANPDRRWSKTPSSNRRRRNSGRWSAPTFRDSTCKARPMPAAPARKSTASCSAA